MGISRFADARFDGSPQEAFHLFDLVYRKAEVKGQQLNALQIYALRQILKLPISNDQKAAVAGHPLGIAAARTMMLEELQRLDEVPTPAPAA